MGEDYFNALLDTEYYNNTDCYSREDLTEEIGEYISIIYLNVMFDGVVGPIIVF